MRYVTDIIRNREMSEFQILAKLSVATPLVLDKSLWLSILINRQTTDSVSSLTLKKLKVVFLLKIL